MNTLFDKIWDSHVVSIVEDGPTQLYIDRLYCHEVTSPQAFDGMRARGLKCFRPEKIFCMPDTTLRHTIRTSRLKTPFLKNRLTLCQKTPLNLVSITSE